LRTAEASERPEGDVRAGEIGGSQQDPPAVPQGRGRSTTGKRIGRGWIAAVVLALMGLAGTVGMTGRYPPWLLGRRPPVDVAKLPKAVVHRADLRLTVRAPGQVESARRTVIECELQNFQFSSHGNVITGGGASTILEIVSDGAIVHKGDVLCQLDASDYEELVRQQEIKVQEAQSMHRRAELDLGTAQAALREYRDGTIAQLRQSYQGQIALARADVQRQKDRIAWSRNMQKIGYVSTSQLRNEQITLQRTEFNLAQILRDRDTFERFTVPGTLRSLETQVATAQSELTFQTLRRERQESRLEKYQGQVEACTVRAPHDGRVMYATQPPGAPPIEPGTRVRQRQGLFYLPDLAHMEVQAMLHESVVNRIRKGMSALVRVEALPQAELEGSVISVSSIPDPPRHPRQSDEVKNYLGRIQLHVVPERLLPGMTAEVEIVTGQKPKALVVPHEAVTVERGHDVCYVAKDEGLERREITVGEVTEDLLEVTRGLQEGEEVVLSPSQLEKDAEVTGSPEPEQSQPAE
jgi:HlyD family secretion protein